MKLIHSFLCLIAFSFVIVSCQQGVDDDLPNPNPNPTGDSTVLERFVFVDTTQPAGSDTIMSWKYSYDNQRRLSKLVIYGKDPTNPAPQIYTVNFLYNGPDTLPYKTTMYSEDPSNRDWDTAYYTYQNGTVIADSLRGRSLNLLGPNGSYTVSVNRYTIVSPTTVTRHRKSMWAALGDPLGPLCESDYTYTKTYTLGNITRQDETSTGCWPAGGTTLTEATYDNHPNPFYNVELPWPILNENGYYVYPFLSQRNNTLTIDNNVMISYVYNSPGYPKSMRMWDVSDPAVYIKGLYYYKR